MGGSGWDEGYMQRYPTQQYGHGVRNDISNTGMRPISSRGGSSKLVRGVITNIADADTFTVKIDGDRKIIRLEGVDAPELSHKSQVWDALNPWSRYSNSNGYNPLSAVGKAFNQPFGWEGTERVKELVGDGTVSVSFKEKDKFGRYVGDIITGEGKSVAQTLIKEGYAHPYQPGTRFYSSDVFTPELRKEWLKTVEQGKGLYSDPSYIMPVEYKHPTIGTIVSMLIPLQESTASKTNRALIERQVVEDRAKALGIPQGFASLASKDQGYLLPASMGGSYFYARGQYNALMRQAGLTENIITNDDASVATSMYQVGYLAKHGRNANSLPQDVGSTVVAGALVGTLMGGLSGRVGGALIGTLAGGLLGAGVGLTTSYVTQYDKELTGGGLGAAINEWGASNDWVGSMITFTYPHMGG